MLKVTIAGRLGRDAEHRATQDGTDICNFTVATDVGYGQHKQTLWIDVAKFGKGAKGLVQYLNKGDPVTVVGDLTTREHDGKTYLKCRADHVELQGSRSQNGAQGNSGGSQSNAGAQQGGGANYDDLDDDIPF